MKTITKVIPAVIAIFALANCTSIKQNANDAVQQAKVNGTSGFYAGSVDGGYEAGGNAETSVFGVRPYASFKVGVKYAPSQQAAPSK